MEPFITRRSTYVLLLLGFGISVVFFSLGLTRQRQEVRTRAAAETTLTVVPQATNVQVGDEFSVNVEMQTGNNQVAAADIVVNFDSSKVQGLSIVKGSFLPNVFSNGSINGGTAQITVAASPAQPAQGSGTIAVLQFRALASGSVEISLGNNTNVAALGENSSVVAQKIPGTVNIASGGSVSADTTIYAFPQTVNVIRNEKVYIPIHMDTGSNQVSGVDLRVRFDSAKLDPISMSIGSFLPVTLTGGSLNDGSADIVLASEPGSAKQGTGVLVVLELLAQTTGTAVVRIDGGTAVSTRSSTQNILKSTQSSTITISEISPTPTPGVGGCPVPAVVNLTSAVAQGSNSVALYWNGASGATGYGVVYGIQPGVYIYGTSNVGNVTSYTVGNLNPNTQYYFAVFATNSCGGSAYSNERNATTQQASSGGVYASASPTAQASPTASFAPINPNSPFFSGGGVVPSPTVAPLPALVMPESTPEATSSFTTSLSALFASGSLWVIIFLVLLLIGSLMLLYFLKKRSS